MPPTSMKGAFLESMRQLYPDGVNNREQHRDLIHCYSMGWCDALMAANDKAAVAAWCEEFEPISKLGWFPDASWQWRVGPTRSLN